MTARTHILVVEDDMAIRAMVAACLTSAGHRVTEAEDATAMRAVLETQEVDLVILDLNLPDGDGMSLARALRARSGLGIIMLTSRTEPADRASGLEQGADDYVTKPFFPRELLARVKNVLERSTGRPGPDRALSFGPFRLDIENRTLTGPAGAIDLTPAEFDLLAFLASRPGRILSRDRLIASLSGIDAESGPRSVDILVSRLRKKLGEPGLIETLRGQGYRFVGVE